jgi:DNA-directed RNA polymerase specialized sigma24 family protein
MDIDNVRSLSDVPERKRRRQTFLQFKLRPSDGALLDLLPAKYRELLISDGSYKERSERLGIPIGTVRSRIHRARVALERLRNTPN